jgi:spore photoproduct lyase
MSILPHFSHLYIEKAAHSLPLTTKLITRFPKATIIEITNYKELFNRPRQQWQHQQNSKKLIIGVRRDAFLYPGSPFVPNFDHSRFFYTTPVLNCIYGCEYCYLQGMFSSANLVAFANTDDFLSQASHALQGAPSYLCVSYDTDLLAMEDLFGYCTLWNDFAHKNPHVMVEVRTKSANVNPLLSWTPAPNMILAWTLSPSEVVQRFEHGTPSLTARLQAIGKAIQHGITVRLCLDPVVRVNGWQKSYHDLIEQIRATVDIAKVMDISVGVFRINSSYLREMQERLPHSRIVTYPYAVENGAASYAPHEREELINTVVHQLETFVPKEKICLVPWQL